MASTATILKRTAVTQAWNMLITNATGEAPLITTSEEGTRISWKPGQAKRMESYLNTLMQGKEPSENDLNVKVDLMPVLLPLVVKKTALYVLGYTALTVIATKLLWK